MSINSSSLRSIVPQFFFSSNSSAEELNATCLDSTDGTITYTTYAFTNVALLPLYVYVLFAGFQQWRRRRLVTMSHSDFFTFHMIFVEIFGVLGSVAYVLGSYVQSKTVVELGVFLFGVIFPGQSSFHVFTSVERYLAVVHAVRYMHWSEAVKVRVRNISAVAVWLLCSGWLGLQKLYLPDFPTAPLMPFLAVCLFITAFCCVSVLCFLRRRGPGEANGRQQRADPSKRRAFNMIVGITVTLLLRIVGSVVSFGLGDLILIDLKHFCSLMDAGLWLTVPSSLVLPLLFLHKAGKLPRCRSRV